MFDSIFEWSQFNNFDKDYLIKSLVKFLNHAQLLDLLDSIDREIF